MKFTVSFASVALAVLALPLLWVKPGPALPAVERPGGAQAPIKTIYPTFTTIDVPGAGVTGVYGINSAGDMVGYYGADSNAPHKHGFLLKGGILMRVDYPRSSFTSAYGINDAGLIVGAADLHGGAVTVGFTYDGTAFKGFRDGRDTVTIPYGINNRGDIVGASGGLYTTKGFAERDGLFRTINFPGQNVYADATGVNDLGEIVGFTDYDAYSLIGGQFQNLDVPGALETEARGINDNGVVVGWYGVYAGCVCAFAEVHGQYFSFSYPGAAFTAADGITVSGQVVGQYTFDYQTWHGFATTLNLGPGS